MIDHRPFASLGHADHGWLKAAHHFSFAAYHDPARLHWGALRVWNDDSIAAHSGFAPHPHADMEIITFVHAGAISHRDSLGNDGRIGAGEVQVMHAGTGITHSEMNREGAETRLFQIWIMPDAKGGPAGWEQRQFSNLAAGSGFVTLASGMAGVSADALPLRADARVMGAQVAAGEIVEHRLGAGRHAYLVAIDGRIRIDGVEAAPRDGIAIKDHPTIRIEALEDTQIILVETR